MDLARILEFSQDDLNANRSGVLSEMQLYILRVKRQRSVLTGLAIIGIMAFIATLCIFLGQRNDSPILVLVGIGVTLCSAGITGIFARHWMRISGDIYENKVMAISGKVERVAQVHAQFRTVTYLLRVNKAEFVVSKEAFNAFQQGEVYTLYRAPYSGVLLSAEKS